MESKCEYDIKGFWDELGLPLRDIANFYSEFINEVNSGISDIKNLQEKKDWKKIKMIIHNFKGISVNYRIVDIYEKSVEICDALKSGSNDPINLDLDRFYLICENATEEIRKYFSDRGISI